MHLFVIALVITMINLMFWQIRRLHEKQAINRKVEQDARRPPITLEKAAADVAAHGADTMRFRRVTLTGRFDPAEEVTVDNRTFNGAPGRWIVTPFSPNGGEPAVIVVRGWVPLSIGADARRPVAGIEPPRGDVTVEGYVEPTQTRGAFGPTDPPTGHLRQLARVDVARIEKQYGPVVPGFFVQMMAQDPPAAAALVPVPTPEPDEGPHRSYAGQWALFTLVVLIGYPIALRHNARAGGRLRADDPAGDDPPPA